MKPPRVAACIAALLAAAAAFFAGTAGGAALDSLGLWACAILTAGSLMAADVIFLQKKIKPSW